MIDRRSQLQSFGFLVSDLVLTAVAWLAAYYVRFQAGWFAWQGDVPPFFWCWRQLPLLMLLAAVGYRLAGRRAGWAFLRHLRTRGFNQTQALIVGTGRVARRLARTFHKLRWLGIVNAGFIEERRGPLSADLPVLGGFDDLPRLISEKS